MRKNTQKGLSLLELVIAVSVLVILSGVVVDLLTRAQDSTSYETTIKRLDRIKKAFHEYSRDTVVSRVAGPGFDSLSGNGIIYCSCSTSPAQASANGYGITLQSSPLMPLSSKYLTGAAGSTDADIFRDGWGRDFLYASKQSPGSITPSRDQAIAYIWSPGLDGISDFTGQIATAKDDIVIELDFSEEFNAEAQRRVDLINGAIYAYLRTFDPTQPTVSGNQLIFGGGGSGSGTTQQAATMGDMAVDTPTPTQPQVDWENGVINPLFQLGFLPANPEDNGVVDPRFLYSTWYRGGSGNYGYGAQGDKAPVASVVWLAPSVPESADSGPIGSATDW